MNEAGGHLLPVGDGIDQCRQSISQTPSEPSRGQRQRQDTKLIMEQDQLDLLLVEARVGKADHVESCGEERKEQSGHEPMERDGDRAVALFRVRQLCHGFMLRSVV